MATDVKTFLEDGPSLEALVERLPAPALAEYRSFGALSLESVFPSRRMLVYTLRGQQPERVAQLVFGQFTVDWGNGPAAEISCEGVKTLVTTTPTRVAQRDLFLHIPQNFVLKYKGRRNPPVGVDFVSHYAVLIKTRSKEIHQVEGHTCCVTLNKFRERFPDLNIRY